MQRVVGENACARPSTALACFMLHTKHQGICDDVAHTGPHTALPCGRNRMLMLRGVEGRYHRGVRRARQKKSALLFTIMTVMQCAVFMRKCVFFFFRNAFNSCNCYRRAQTHFSLIYNKICKNVCYRLCQTALTKYVNVWHLRSRRRR